MPQTNLLGCKGYKLKQQIVIEPVGKGSDEKKIKCRLYVSKNDIKEAKKRKRVKRKISDTPPPNNTTIDLFYGIKYVPLKYFIKKKYITN